MSKAKTEEEQKEAYNKAADDILSKYLTKDFDWKNVDFQLLTTMRYDPALYKGELPLLEAIYKEPLDDSFFFLLDNHVRRINLEREFFEFDKVGVLTSEILLKHLTEAMKGLGIDKVSPYRVRLSVDKEGEIHLELRGPVEFPINTDINCPITFVAHLDSQPTVISPFTSFKTTNRNAYDSAMKREIPEGSTNVDVLLYNTGGYITESSACNVAFQRLVKNPLTGKETLKWVTPPLSVGCIEGTVRKHLMDEGLIHEATVPVESLEDGETVLLFNAVRGLFKAKLAL
ncbi:DEKNAAC101725 [Brettanomyces naardenensis]|uniref:DEKNAAC101725 n=1 Tax=Brettanomyces naardenensis TaxID=13370 RepID=A0A448YIR8_BRENA|nr:DEKNAAC101725 [Brettanomyces naardenensis]